MSRTYHHGRKQKEKLFGDLWHWMYAEPKWYRKEFKHTPQRAKRREAITKIVRSESMENDVEFPLDKKPRKYYW